MFTYAHKFNGEVNGWDTSNVRNMYYMFHYAYDFDQDLDKWDTSSVTDMHYMFEYAHDFNGKVGTWDVSQVTSMRFMFRFCYVFNQNVSSWDTSRVTDMSYMFYDARLFTYDVSKWIGSAVENYQSEMFSGATAFKAKYWCPDVNRGPTEVVSMLLHLFLPDFLDAAFPSILCFDPNHERKHQRRRQGLVCLQTSAKNYVDWRCAMRANTVLWQTGT